MTINIEMKRIYLVLFLFVVFIAGGSLQYAGLVSNTQTTLFIVFLYVLVSILNFVRRLRVEVNSFDLALLLMGAVVVLSGFMNKTSPIKTIGYFIYLLVPFVAYSVSRFITKEQLEVVVLRYLIFLSILQLPVILIQKALYGELSSIHEFRIIEEDARFGTFFLANDVGLCFFLILLVILCLFGRVSQFQVRGAWLVIIISTITVFSTNSKASMLLLLVVFAYYAYFKMGKLFKKISIVFMLSFSLTFVFYAKGALEVSSLQDFRIVGDFEKIEGKEYGGASTLPRFAPVIIFLNQPLKWIGEGPYDFHDPLSKKWRYGSGHSQIFWTYNDVGVIGLLIPMGALFFISQKNKKNKQAYVLPFFVFCVYSIVTTTLSDISIMFNYFFFTALLGWEER